MAASLLLDPVVVVDVDDRPGEERRRWARKAAARREEIRGGESAMDCNVRIVPR
jgi:hypothetical protein